MTEVIDLFEEAGLEALEARQTLFSEPDPVRKGHGEGGFVVLRGQKPA